MPMHTLLDAISVNNVFIREWLNGALIPLNISMMTIIGYTVWRLTKFRWGWTKYPGANSACALWWIFFADFLRSVLAWAILREAQSNGYATEIYRTSPIATMVYIAAALIATGATLRCIWCLTPVKGRSFTWITALIFTITFIAVAYIGTFDSIAHWVIVKHY